MEYLAHDKQSLKEHLNNVKNIAGDFGKKFGAEKCAGIVGLLHDFGKYTEEYQDYLNKSIRGEKTRRGDVIHAFQGAKYVLDNVREPLVADILSNPIAAHHGGLYDIMDDLEKTLLTKLKKLNDESKLHFQECYAAFEKENGASLNFNDCQNEIVNVCQKSDAPCFMLHLFTKAIYSCIIDADRCDSAGFKVDENNVPDWSVFISKLEDHLNKFDNSNELNKVRQKISAKCKDAAAARGKGVYSLSIPTGGGKTLSSLRFALEHAKEYELEHIIYVIPYLSILDQNAKVIKEMLGKEFGEENVLEHHSNLDLSDDEDKESEHDFLASRWDSPIILTTMVQFLESIYSNKVSKLRKFHNMAKSVFIFDEIQSLPIKCIHLFNDAINFLHDFGNATILLCTATTPHLHNVERSIKMSNNPELISLPEDEKKCFERTKIKWDTRDVLEIIEEQLDMGKSTLVVLNTKATAKKIFEQCQKIECEKIFLTTDLCPAHRLNVLKKLNDNLKPKNKNDKKLSLCVSTQLIEAGVDISFDCVIRACAGTDSIIQAAGRCNRNGEEADPQDVFVVYIEDQDPNHSSANEIKENLSNLQEIKEGKDCTERIFRETGDIDIDRFYCYYYDTKDIKNKMDYPTKKGSKDESSIYNLLNNNDLYFKGEPLVDGLPASFKMAAEKFSVIDKQQTGIVVPYGDAEELVKSFQKTFDPKEKYSILKKLQKYSISVRSYKLEQLEECGAIQKIDDSFYYLWEGYYDNEYLGLLSEPKDSIFNQ